MYRNLEAEITRLGMSKKEFSTFVGISYNTFLLKLKGYSSFSLDEALKIKSLLKIAIPVEYLFANNVDKPA